MAPRGPIFVLGAHKSGTSLVRAVLDGHPELLAIPLETHFMRAGGVTSSYLLDPLRRVPAGQASLERASEMYLTAQRATGDGGLALAPELHRIAHEFCIELSDVELGPAALLDALASFWFRQGAGTADAVVVEKSVEHVVLASVLRECFPCARLVFVVREPARHLLSIRRHFDRKGGRLLRREVLAIAQGLVAAEAALEDEDSFVLRYEDLVATPEELTGRLAKFLEVPWSTSMLHPTILGRDWAGNSTLERPEMRFGGAPTSGRPVCLPVHLGRALAVALRHTRGQLYQGIEAAEMDTSTSVRRPADLGERLVPVRLRVQRA